MPNWMPRSKTTTMCSSCCFPTWPRTMLQYRTFQQRLTYARANVEIQRQSFQLATDKFEGGATTERDTHQAKQVLEETEALIPALEIGKRQAANRLCVLLGMPPRDLDAILGAGSGIPVTPPDVVVGVPADLVRRRPDVRRAERQVAAQSARIGVAVSDLFPHFSVLGTIGVEAEQFGDLFKSGSMIGEISPGFRWDILNYGRLVNNVRVQDARFQQLAYAYQDQVLDAGREVEDAIVVFLRSQEQAQHLDASVVAAARTVEITNEQYNEGLVDFTAVYLFQTTLTEQQDELAVAQGDIALGLIDVYRSLGGGWQIRLGGDSPQAEPMPLPLLEEMPPPEAQQNDIQFQSFLTQFTFDEATDAELTRRARAAVTDPHRINLTELAMSESRHEASPAALRAIVAYFASDLSAIAALNEPAAVERRIYPLQAMTCPDALLRGCCDDLLPKAACRALPASVVHAVEDDYCRKPCPCVPCFRGCCTTDCYCRKPCPDLCRPLAADYFTCASRGAACGEFGRIWCECRPVYRQSRDRWEPRNQRGPRPRRSRIRPNRVRR